VRGVVVGEVDDREQPLRMADHETIAARLRGVKIFREASREIPTRQHRGREIGRSDPEYLAQRALQREAFGMGQLQRALVLVVVVGGKTQLPEIGEQPEQIRLFRIREADRARQRARHRSAHQGLTQHLAHDRPAAGDTHDLVDQQETRREVADGLEPEQDDRARDRRHRLAARAVEARVDDPQHLR
jgi:hypothetical protein